MKNIVIIISLLMSLITNNYEKQDFEFDKAWIEVENDINNRLPKSALEKTEKILLEAEKAKNKPQQAKSLIYIGRLTIETDESGVEVTMQRYEQKIKELPAPLNYILASYTAELYQNYFDNNRWRIAERTEITEDENSNYKVWSTQNFLNTIEQWYLYSIKEKADVNISVDAYRLIMNDFNTDGQVFRPTVYEVLVDRAIYFFDNYSNYEVSNPNSFQIDEPWYFDDVNTFVKQKINDKDITSLNYKVLSLYQSILKNEINSKNRFAQADYDLKRIQYVYSKSTLENMDELYVRSLENLTKTYKDIDFHTEIVSIWAQHIIDQQIGDHPKVAALKICEQAVKLYPKSNGAAKCQMIINQIKNPELNIYGEAVYPANKSMLFAIDHNNIRSIDIVIYNLPKDFRSAIINKTQAEILEYVKNQKKISSSSLQLNVSPVYESQRTEWNSSGLEYGKYALVMESKGSSVQASQFVVFDVSNLAYTTYLVANARAFMAVDRVSGAPVKDVTVELRQEKYDAKSKTYKHILTGTYKTNKDGMVHFEDKGKVNFKVTLKKGKDELDYDKNYYNYVRNEPEPYQFAEFYTDRAIYRPGQIVYYKAILIENDKNRIPSLIKDRNVTISFQDANNQEITKIDKKSNEFGSVNGSFTIPVGKLAGTFSIQLVSKGGSIYGRKTIWVEEYKRPTFEVTLDKPKDATQLEQLVALKGNAISLAGVAIDNAIVGYKVTRITSFPFWRGWWPIPSSDGEFIVKTGTINTDGNGNYDISFLAIPDKKIKKSDNPVFNYKVEVSVTDIQGETRTASTVVSASYTAFQLMVDLKDDIDVSDLDFIKIKAKGASGQEIPVKGKLEISKLIEPNQVKIQKYWDGIAQFPLPSNIYNKTFPQYSALPINDYESWKIEKVVLKSDFDTKDSIDVRPYLKAGVYKIISKSKDQNGQEVQGVDYKVVTDFNNNHFPKTSFLFVKQNSETYQPGDNFELNLGTPASKVQVHIVLEKEGKVLATHNVLVNKTGKISLPITEAHRGGLNYRLFYVKENRWYSKSSHISVPWTNKELMITFETFRDKTLPGSEEQYKIKISGMNKEKVISEVLAAMYDGSLDQFRNQYWRSDYYPSSYSMVNPQSAGFELISGLYYNYGRYDGVDIKDIEYPTLIRLSDYYPYRLYSRSSGSDIMYKSSRNQVEDMQEAMPAPPPPSAEANDALGGNDEAIQSDDKDPSTKEVVVQPRKNLKETVFFFPDIKTDSDGNLILSFTMNEALTKWRLMLLAHTQDFKLGYESRYVQTQKELMILPNAPRFLRDGDIASINAKVSNLSENAISGNAKIQIWDAITMQDITSELVTSPIAVPFEVTKGSSKGVSWELTVPETKYNAITYRVSAISSYHSDAEENTIPVITNRILVTETMPFWVPGNTTRTFNFNAFKNNVSPTKKDFKFTFEYTASPIWYAIQALPYIEESNNASTQTLIDRMYANVLASAIAKSHPKIKAVFDQWQAKDKDALISNLSKNEDLKSALLEETPWVRQALSESEQKRNIAILFDLNRLGNEKAVTIQKLRERQLSNGGFPWIAGGIDNVYITQLIMENIGHLYHLGALQMDDPDWSDIVSASLNYMDESMEIRFNKLKVDTKKYNGNLQNDHLDDLSIQYFYVKSFFDHVKPNPKANEAIQYYWGQAEKYWLNRNIYSQAMIGLIMNRKNNPIGQKIVKSLRERSFQNDEMGMYWNEGNGYYWNQLPIERHALLIELFSTASNNVGEVDRLKIWLLKNKQTTHWSTSKATAAAIYALLIQGESGGISKWVTESTEPVIMVGKELINTSTQTSESGTGYIKKDWSSADINKDQAKIKVTNNNTSIAWGGAYYQYFENLDNVKSFKDTPLKLNRKLYKVESTDKGDQLTVITEKSRLNPGDKIKVRIELTVDREMEFVHMKDMRASGLEPVNVISSYKYQGGLGYYESTKDMATHFYFTYLTKGTFVFEYTLRVAHRGDFSSGITSIESMYAPEFSSHSEGIRIKVK